MCTAPISTGRPTAVLIEVIIRDLRREAPGRRTNSASRMNPASATARRLEEKTFTAPSRSIRGASSDHLQSPLPPCLVEEMDDRPAQKQQPVAPCGLQVLVIGSLE